MLFRKQNTGAITIPSATMSAKRQEEESLHERIGELESELKALRRAEQERAAAHQLLQTIVERSLDAIVTVDPAGRITSANPAAERVSGYSAAELLGKNIAQLCAPDQMTRTLQIFHQTLLGDSQLIETAFLAKDGSRVEVRATGGPLTSGGQVTGVFAILCNISERKRMEQSLRVSERGWQATFDAMSDGICLLTTAGVILRCNKAMAEIVGRPVETLLGQPCYQVVHGTDAPVPNCPLARVRAGKQREAEVIEVRGRWYQLVCDPLLAEDGELIGAVHRMTDITRQRAMEAELRQAREDLARRVTERTAELSQAMDLLRENEQRYRLLFENTSEAMYVVDCETMQLEQVNEAAAALHGYTREEILQLRADQLSGEPEKTRQRYAEIRASGQLIPALFHRPILRRDGTMRLAEVVGTVYRNGSRLKLIAAARDVTGRHRLEREVLEISDRERRRIGEDLEDTVCRPLAEVAQLVEQASNGAAVAPEIFAIGKLANRAWNEAHGLARVLLPVDLETRTLAAALQELAELAEKLFRVRCSVEVTEPQRLEDRMSANQLYRLAQEAISHAIRQGEAKHIWVRLVSSDSATSLTVRDDGMAYSKHGNAPLGGRILRHRAEIMGGSLEFQLHGSGTGATLTCSCPNTPAWKGSHS